MKRACAAMSMFESLMTIVDTISALPEESRGLVIDNLHNACVELDKSIRVEVKRAKENGVSCTECPVCDKIESVVSGVTNEVLKSETAH